MVLYLMLLLTLSEVTDITQMRRRPENTVWPKLSTLYLCVILSYTVESCARPVVPSTLTSLSTREPVCHHDRNQRKILTSSGLCYSCWI